jgi:hypothetical protein
LTRRTGFERSSSRTIEPKVANGGTWWQLATLAEATLGLDDVEKMSTWLERAAQVVSPREWELESTVRQLATLARLTSERRADGGSYRVRAEAAIRRHSGFPQPR